MLTRPARAAALLLTVPLVVLAAACGGKSSATSTSGSTASSGSAAFTAYRDCLTKHGVKLPARPSGTTNGTRPTFDPSQAFAPGAGGDSGTPSGTSPGRGRFSNDPAFAAASKACASLRPSGGFGGGFGGRGSAGLQAFQAFASCMKDHGITIPTRGGSAGATGSTTTSGPTTTLDRNTPAYAAAYAACKALLPTTPSNSSTSTTAAAA
jgi:hypothetical protein